MSAAPRTSTNSSGERTRRLERFGSHVEMRVQSGPARAAQAEHRLDRAESLLAEFDHRLSRFKPESELCRLNADDRDRVPASPMMQRFVEAVGWAGRRSGGLVDATVLPAVERSGYRSSIDLAELDRGGRASTLRPWAPSTAPGAATHPAVAMHGAPAEDDAPAPTAALGAALSIVAAQEATTDVIATGSWRDVRAGDGCVVRPAGVRLDSGGIGKGLAADLAAEFLRGAPSWMVDCGGDLRIGGTAGMARPVDVTDPLDPSRVIHRLHVTRGGVATSGVTRRSWDRDGVRSHHLIDPRTGQPADTGVLQVTALAPTTLEAEVLAKTALLSGPEQAHERLEHGGVIVCANGLVIMVPPPRVQQIARARRVRARFSTPGKPSVLRLVEQPR
jgi:thiamine biosynthesis lipoprotein